MTLVLKKPLVLRNQLPADAEADAYIAAVEAADGQALEPGVKFAIKNFVLCCKQDGIWPAIKASCILAGARTLNGALVPLVGTAPTNFNFVSGDYNRKTGLQGDAFSTKRISTNRSNSDDPTNSNHNAIYATVNHPSGTGRSLLAGGNNLISASPNAVSFRNRSGTSLSRALAATGLLATSRNNSNTVSLFYSSSIETVASVSNTATSGTITLFSNEGGGSYSGPRLAFYSIGESLDLALLDARVTDLINAFGAAIP